MLLFLREVCYKILGSWDVKFTEESAMFTENHVLVKIFFTNGLKIGLSRRVWHLIQINSTKWKIPHFYLEPSWGCSRINRLLLCGGLRPSVQKSPGYGIKQPDVEAPEMLELWGMQSTSSMPSLLDPLYPWVVAPDKVLFMGQIEHDPYSSFDGSNRTWPALIWWRLCWLHNCHFLVVVSTFQWRYHLII